MYIDRLCGLGLGGLGPGDITRTHILWLLHWLKDRGLRERTEVIQWMIKSS